MPIVSRNKARFDEDNQDELRPETFGIRHSSTNHNYNKNNHYDDFNSIQNKRHNNINLNDEENNYKFWILAVVFILLPSIMIARSPLIKINLNNSIQANFIELPELEPLTGNLAPNRLLEKASFIGHHKMRGPECIVSDKEGNLFTGLVNGSIVKIDKHDRRNIKVLSHMGEETSPNICNSSPFGNPKCGRPLGLRLDQEKNVLYVTDSYYGIFKINILTGAKTQILSSSDPRFGTARPKLVDDLDIDGDTIYFIDSSYERDYSEYLEEHIEALSRGRLFRYNQTSNELEFLIENLYYPNGLQLTPNKDAILINENTMARIIKFYLKGDKKDKREIFVDLPGFGDNIRLTSRQTYMVAMPAIRHKTSNLDMFGQYPLVRTFMGYIVDIRKAYEYMPKYGLVVEYDLSGNVIKSWHDSTGKLADFSHAELFQNKLYLGSFFNDYIAVVDY